MIESLKKTVNDYIIYNIDFTNSTIVKSNYLINYIFRLYIKIIRTNILTDLIY